MSHRLVHFSSLTVLLLATACSSDDDVVVVTDAALSAAQVAELDGFMTSALERYTTPGAAVAIVRGKDVVYAKGFGTRRVETGEPVTTDTRFAIGSSTKSMTALMLATLVEDGKLDWDDTVSERVPGFEFSSDQATKTVRLRHLLNHSSGVERRNTGLFLAPLTPTAMLGSIRDIPVLAAPGEHYEYNNQTYAAAGYAGVLATGASYDDSSLSDGFARLMRERVFDPVGMSRATLDPNLASEDDDRSWSHSYNGATERLESIPAGFERFLSTVTPAGGVWASVRDVAAYVSTQLHGVAPSGTRIVSESTLEEMHTGTIVDAEDASYGLGWHERLDAFHGQRAVFHDGDTLGFVSEMMLLPESGLGVVVLGNRAVGTYFYRAVERFALETALGFDHESDEAEAAGDAETITTLRDLGQSSSPVPRDEALPFVGEYTQGIGIDHGDSGFTLRTQFGEMPLVSSVEPGVYFSGGVLNGRFVAAFDTTVTPTRLDLDLIFNEGKAQPFSVESVAE